VKKIPTIFERDHANTKLVSNVVVEGCEWVLAGDGTPTRKWDGTACMVRDGKLYKRVEWDAKKGPAPVEWLHHDFDPSVRSGHGWLPVGIGPEDWMHRKAWARGKDDTEAPLRDGTYELIGPKIGKNPERVSEEMLVPHGRDALVGVPRTFDGLRAWLAEVKTEGIVWHHADGRMAKIKRRDFGIPWPVKEP